MSFYICLYQEGINSMHAFLKRANSENYSVIATSINANMQPFERYESDPAYPATCLHSSAWCNKVILVLSDVDVDSRNAKLQKNAKRILLQDISWAEHLQGGYGRAMTRLHGQENTQLAGIIRIKAKSNWFINVPIENPELATFEHRSDVTEIEKSDAQAVDTWSWWNSLRFAVNHSSKVKVILNLNSSKRPNRECVRRWLGEPIEAVLIPSTLFVLNDDSKYVLQEKWRVVVGHFMNVRANIIISADPTDNAVSQYANDIKTLFGDVCKKHFFDSYENVLQDPIQPLAYNLDTQAYEILETDPVKYKAYQRAVQQALLERVTDAEADTKLTVVMVLGGGRGTLARCVFNAAALAKRKVRLYIIEKNPSAIRTLTSMVKTLWADKNVQLVSKDMRFFSPPELADIIVSELLGSFGDNMLSPECLDCTAKLLKPDGISIPCESSSLINPLMSGVLHSNVSELNQSAFNKGYVTLLKNIYHIDEPQALFKFTHPNLDAVVDNSRYKELSFKVKANCVIHGIGGYFEAVLYNDIKLSISPLAHTEGMISWFPMYFPLYPCTVKAGDTISIKFWRRVDPKKVWYEWQLSQPTIGHVHNVAGVGYNMTL